MITPEQLREAIETQCETETVTENTVSVIGPLALDELALALDELANS